MLVNNGPGDGLLPDSTKPQRYMLPMFEPFVVYFSDTGIQMRQFLSTKYISKYHLQNVSHFLSV